jgi:hypothetical protein
VGEIDVLTCTDNGIMCQCTILDLFNVHFMFCPSLIRSAYMHNQQMPSSTFFASYFSRQEIGQFANAGIPVIALPKIKLCMS